MSRLGKKAVLIPPQVEVKLEGRVVVVKGPKGALKFPVHALLQVTIEDKQVSVTCLDQKPDSKIRAQHGLLRAMLQNMIKGVTKGFEKRLSMVGVGYRAALQGNLLDLQVGNSHPTKLQIPQGVSVVVDKGVSIVISGIDAQVVGQFAAEVRGIKPPEPYKGKGIRFENEYVRKKAGKAAKAKAS